MWYNVTICLFTIHRVQYQNGVKTSMTYLTKVHSFCVVESGRHSLYIGFWSLSGPNSCDRKARAGSSTVKYWRHFACIISTSTMQTCAFWHSMNSFWQPVVSIINTASILCYLKVSFRTVKYLEICTISITLAKSGLIADTSLIRALPSVLRLSLFLMSMLWFSPNCRSRSWASQDLVWHFTPKLLMNAPTASFVMGAMHSMWFLNAGHSILVASKVDCSSRLIQWFEEALALQTPSKRPSETSKSSIMRFICMASLAPVCLPLTYHP